LVNILNKAKVDFGILGTDELCCGDPVRWIGETGLFEELKQRNTEMIEKHGVSKIVTMSPHCYDAFNSYYDLKKTKIQHYTEFLYELVHTGRVKPAKKVNIRITYQDPCTLGRKHKVFDEPREILKSIPGVDLIEMERSRDDSFCCGGGAGRVWLEIPVRERLSVARLREALKTKPDVVATSCPFCLIELEDAVKTIGDEHVKIRDIAEIFAESIE
jgi:Fe-S oxidoreductase